MQTINRAGNFWVSYAAVFIALVLASVSVFAEPATYESDIAITFNQPATGAPDGYRLYEGCDLSSNTTGALVDGSYTSGKAYSLAGDTDTPPTLCVIAFNAAGEGPFAQIVTLTAAATAPGAVVDVQVGTCTVTVPSGATYDCTITVN